MATYDTHIKSSDYFHPLKSWRTCLISGIFLLYLTVFWLFSLYDMGISVLVKGTVDYTGTTFLLGITYIIFLTVAVLTCLQYVIRMKNDTTVIPCINATWYKLYTIFLFLIATVVFILGCVETHNSRPGVYTTFRKS
jgi:hypothetical protein